MVLVIGERIPRWMESCGHASSLVSPPLGGGERASSLSGTQADFWRNNKDYAGWVTPVQPGSPSAPPTPPDRPPIIPGPLHHDGRQTGLFGDPHRLYWGISANRGQDRSGPVT